MEKFKTFRWVLLASATVFAASCSSVSPDCKSTRTKFREADAANMVVRFYSWDSVQMTRPDTRENGFLPLLNRETVAHELDRAGVGRDLAVVVLGYFYSKDQEAQVFEEWKTLLGERGFHRLVFLRAGGKYNIDGLIVIRDSVIAAADDEQRKTANTFAAVPTTARTDAADPSGNPIP